MGANCRGCAGQIPCAYRAPPRRASIVVRSVISSPGQSRLPHHAEGATKVLGGRPWVDARWSPPSHLRSRPGPSSGRFRWPRRARARAGAPCSPVVRPGRVSPVAVDATASRWRPPSPAASGETRPNPVGDCGRGPRAVHSRRRPPCSQEDAASALRHNSVRRGMLRLIRSRASPIGSWPRHSTAFGAGRHPDVSGLRRAAGIWGSTAFGRLLDDGGAGKWYRLSVGIRCSAGLTGRRPTV